VHGDRPITGLILLIIHATGLLTAPFFAWTGRWAGLWMAGVAAGGTTLFACLYPFLGRTGTHGSESESLAWALLIVAPFVLGGFLIVALLSCFLAKWGARRREAMELAGEAAIDGSLR
jgi:hypothetical protein